MRQIAAAFGRFFFACALLLASCAPALAAHVEVGLGMSRALTNGDGTWYQSAFPHTLDLRSLSGMVGVTGDLSEHVAYHADAVWLGRFGENSQNTPNDGNYAKGIGCVGPCLPMANYIGSGWVAGFAPTIEWHTTGAWRFGVEGGPWFYRETWRESVPNWYPSKMISPRMYVPIGSPRPVMLDSSQTRVSYVLGVSLERGTWGIRLRYYDDHQYFPGTGGNATNGPPLWKGQWDFLLTKEF